jgi:hypothetical protein
VRPRHQASSPCGWWCRGTPSSECSAWKIASVTMWTSGLEGTVLVTLNGSFSGADDEGACSGLDDVVGDRFKFVDLEDSCDLWKEALE